MGEKQFENEYVLTARFMTKKELIRAYRYGSLDPGIKVTVDDYRWFDKHIACIKHKFMKRYENGKQKRQYTPREVEFIFDLLKPPVIYD